jgi:hypothetical protein
LEQYSIIITTVATQPENKMIAQEKMVEVIRADVVDLINEVGVEETAEVYGVEYDAEDSFVFVEQCVAAELDRAFC